MKTIAITLNGGTWYSPDGVAECDDEELFETIRCECVDGTTIVITIPDEDEIDEDEDEEEVAEDDEMEDLPLDEIFT